MTGEQVYQFAQFILGEFRGRRADAIGYLHRRADALRAAGFRERAADYSLAANYLRIIGA